ncbi:MAG: cytidylate kinase-like family protein [Erysipelotrichaceae bacterium]|nr:cytidylate kinase-like family protein [Erysipelotrichaceae bacterium]
MEEKGKQMIISISREFGSGGKEIAEILGRRYQLPVLEKNIMQELGDPLQRDAEELYVASKEPRLFGKSRMFRGLTNNNEEVLAFMEFDFLREQAAAGKSFIVLGHCAEEVLKGFPNLVTFFISADADFKIDRIIAEHHVSRAEAEKIMKKNNIKRREYHNYYCAHSWGDSRYYEICLRSDILGPQKTADYLSLYIDAKFDGTLIPAGE